MSTRLNPLFRVAFAALVAGASAGGASCDGGIGASAAFEFDPETCSEEESGSTIIFGGLDADFILKDDDVVNVGSNFVAPFLYVARNSFRFTYGFGFVYDRNFADQDAYSARANPESVEQARRQSRGLPF